MTRPRSLALRIVLVAGSAAGLLAAGSGLATAAPTAAFQGGTTITAHVTGAKPGYDCQIAARDIDGPWRAVSADGVVDLDSGPVPAGPHRVRILCEDRKRGDVATHLVGREAEVRTG
ncbi:hypothetical protein [Nocardia blacklockiae]|uniref:hypothetical protein n=1 Tax=Nocardia blacklockiae TaxID=480036 RepID=UPI001893CECA|nr:hypothetical protein [Nocardia blacklockiae]MBF6176763.1 hypothetical protein [Nocardia blacklockiae]